jgi:hypothetical protein
MKRTVSFIFISLLLLLLGLSLKAQWEDAQVQRLTFDSLSNKVIRFYVDDQDKLHLFFLKKVTDTSTGSVYGSTIMYRTKERGGAWSQPEEIGNPSFVTGLYRKHLAHDVRTGITHMIYQRIMSLDYDTMYYTNSELPDWQLVTIDSMSSLYLADYSPVSIGIDTLGNIHLAWNVDFDSVGVGPLAYNWYRVMYANNSTGEWVKQQVSEPICLYFSTSSPPYLAVQKNGTAHIVYHGEPCDLECVSFYARNDSLNSTNWNTDTVPKPSRPLWHYWVTNMKIDVSDRVHLLTVGCIEYDCFWADRTRTFYYYKQAEDYIWQGEEQIPDTALGEVLAYDYQRLFIDQGGVPYVSYISSDQEVYFTDRKQGGWRVPNLLVSWRVDPDSLAVEVFDFVLDSQGKGHGAFSGFDTRHGFNFDSLEIYYFSSSTSEVDIEEDHRTPHFDLSQNYPNPFNSSTIITYETVQPGNVTLKIYDLLGRQVKELVNTFQEPSRYKVHWDGKNSQGKEVASGIYFYLLRAGERKEAKKMLLLK